MSPTSSSLRREATIWELTARHLGLSTQDILGTTTFEVDVSGTWTAVAPEVFSAWTGARRVDGVMHHGPIFNLGTDVVYTGPRSCPCAACEATVEHRHRKD